MVLGKLPVPGRPTVWMIVGQGPIALAVGAGRGCLAIFNSPLSFFFPFCLSLGDGLMLDIYSFTFSLSLRDGST